MKKQMKDLIDKNKRILAGSITAAVLILLFVMVIYIPQHRKVTGLKLQIKEIEDQINLTKAMLGDLDRLGRVLVEMQDEMGLFEKRLPSQKQISSVLSELSKLAKASSLEVISIRPEKPVPVLDENHQPISLDKSPFKSIKVDLRLRAPYKAVADYLGSIQQSLNILATIDEIIIKSDEAISPRLDSNVILTVYVIDKG